MNNLLEISNIDYNKLKRYLKKTSSFELSNLSEPCYYSSTHKYKYELLNICDLKEKELKNFVKEYWKGTKYSRFLLHNDEYTMLLVFIMYYSITNNDEDLFLFTMLFYVIRSYSNQMYRSIPYCNKQYFDYALERISKLHLFKREKTIPNALYFLSKTFVEKHKDNIQKNDKDLIGKFIQESRHRISQSIKSFASVYYEASEKNIGYQTPYDNAEEIKAPTEKGNALVDNIVKRISTYKNIDNNALEEAIEISEIDKIKARNLLKEITKPDNSEEIRNCLISFLRDIEGINYICDKDFYKYIKQLLYSKKSSSSRFKNSVINLISKLLKSLHYRSIDSIQQNERIQIIFFVSFFITLSLRNMVC